MVYHQEFFYFPRIIKTPNNRIYISSWVINENTENVEFSSLDKIKREGPYAISRPIAPLPPPRESSKRDARKKSLDLPGETQLPQHLEQNRSASGSMRACENLLRNLMTQKMHRVRICFLKSCLFWL